MRRQEALGRELPRSVTTLLSSLRGEGRVTQETIEAAVLDLGALGVSGSSVDFVGTALFALLDHQGGAPNCILLPLVDLGLLPWSTAREITLRSLGAHVLRSPR